ncbi:MAG TPA: hypothetical protein VKB79_19510 [Bryobacteraceae bacterium]|nr:hypothetical protein [Bryobacteraceae bacterium]
MSIPAFKPLAAWVPIAMSLAALGLVLFHLAVFGPAPQVDEGPEAHIFQLLLAAEMPLLIFYAAKWLRRAPKTALLVIGVQLGAVAAAMAPIYLLGW